MRSTIKASLKGGRCRAKSANEPAARRSVRLASEAHSRAKGRGYTTPRAQPRDPRRSSNGGAWARAQRAVAGATSAAIEGIGSVGARTEGKPGAAGAPKIPQALLEALARKVFVGIDRHGDARFEIELGGNLLAGLRLAIQAKDGKVRIQIAGDNREGSRMLAAHHTELAAVFRHKGLDLDELTLENP